MLNLVISMVLLMITIVAVIFIKKATKEASETIGRFASTSLQKQMILGGEDYDAETSVISWLNEQRTKRYISFKDHELLAKYSSIAEANGFVTICGIDEMIDLEEYMIKEELKQRGYNENYIDDVRDRAYEYGEQLVQNDSRVKQAIKAAEWYGKVS